MVERHEGFRSVFLKARDGTWERRLVSGPVAAGRSFCIKQFGEDVDESWATQAALTMVRNNPCKVGLSHLTLHAAQDTGGRASDVSLSI
jgi:hypothetical protein